MRIVETIFFNNSNRNVQNDEYLEKWNQSNELLL